MGCGASKQLAVAQAPPPADSAPPATSRGLEQTAVKPTQVAPAPSTDNHHDSVTKERNASVSTSPPDARGLHANHSAADGVSTRAIRPTASDMEVKGSTQAIAPAATSTAPSHAASSALLSTNAGQTPSNATREFGSHLGVGGSSAKPASSSTTTATTHTTSEQQPKTEMTGSQYMAHQATMVEHHGHDDHHDHGHATAPARAGTMHSLGGNDPANVPLPASHAVIAASITKLSQQQLADHGAHNIPLPASHANILAASGSVDPSHVPLPASRMDLKSKDVLVADEGNKSDRPRSAQLLGLGGNKSDTVRRNKSHHDIGNAADTDVTKSKGKLMGAESAARVPLPASRADGLTASKVDVKNKSQSITVLLDKFEAIASSSTNNNEGQKASSKPASRRGSVDALQAPAAAAAPALVKNPSGASLHRQASNPVEKANTEGPAQFAHALPEHAVSSRHASRTSLGKPMEAVPESPAREVAESSAQQPPALAVDGQTMTETSDPARVPLPASVYELDAEMAEEQQHAADEHKLEEPQLALIPPIAAVSPLLSNGALERIAVHQPLPHSTMELNDPVVRTQSVHGELGHTSKPVSRPHSATKPSRASSGKSAKAVGGMVSAAERGPSRPSSTASKKSAVKVTEKGSSKPGSRRGSAAAMAADQHSRKGSRASGLAQ